LRESDEQLGLYSIHFSDFIKLGRAVFSYLEPHSKALEYYQQVIKFEQPNSRIEKL